MTPYESMGQALWPDVQDWLVTKHASEITKLYEKLFSEYIQDKLGKVDVEARKKLVKSLMKNIIS